MSDERVVATFDEAELAIVLPLGTRRRVEAGEHLYREGDTTYDFYVVLSGLVEITVRADGEDRLIITHGAGRFLGVTTSTPSGTTRRWASCPTARSGVPGPRSTCA